MILTHLGGILEKNYWIFGKKIKLFYMIKSGEYPLLQVFSQDSLKLLPHPRRRKGGYPLDTPVVILAFRRGFSANPRHEGPTGWTGWFDTSPRAAFFLSWGY